MRAHNVAAAIAVALLALMMANVTLAQTKDDDVMMTGTIVSIDGDKYLIQTPEGERVFRFKSGVTVPPNLAPGTQVTMWVDEDDVDDNPPGEKVESEVYTIHRMELGQAQSSPPATDIPPPAAPTPPAEPAPVTPPAEPVTPPPTTPATPTTEEPMTELPQTASPVEILGLVGLLAFASGLGLTIWQKRKVD